MKMKNIFKKEDQEEKMTGLKKHNLDILKKYKADLITALFYDYTRNMPLVSLQELEKVYLEETGKTLDTNYSCSACILKLVRQCSRLYFRELPDELPENLRSRFNG